MDMSEVTARINARLAPLFASLEQDHLNRLSKAARENPQANKLTRVMAEGANAGYVYWSAGKDGKGRKVIFCAAKHRNAAGYFLGWREVESKTETKRDMFTARKVKARVRELAKRRADAFIARHS